MPTAPTSTPGSSARRPRSARRPTSTSPKRSRQRIARLRAAFGGRFALSFAAKCNPNPALLAWLAERVELPRRLLDRRAQARRAGRMGAVARKLHRPRQARLRAPRGDRAGHGRARARIGRARRRRPTAIAAALGRVQDVLVRIAPSRVPKGFGDQMAGRPSPFGIDLEDVARRPAAHPRRCGNLRVVGLHIYSGTQCLRPEAICEN